MSDANVQEEHGKTFGRKSDVFSTNSPRKLKKQRDKYVSTYKKMRENLVVEDVGY